MEAYARFQKGETACSVARDLELQAVTVSRWFRAFSEGDCSLLNDERRRGPKSICSVLFAEDNIKKLRRAFIEKKPIDFLLPYKRWSLSACVELIEKLFGMQVSRVTAQKVLAICKSQEQRHSS